MQITAKPFGVRKDGKKVTEYVMDNGHMSVSVMDHGATILHIMVPDRSGKREDVTLGFDTLGEYEGQSNSFGAFVGRVANRISDHAFTLNGKVYTLEDNNKGACLHGGSFRYNQCFYETSIEENGVTFHRLSPDGEQGFPGNLDIRLTYTLTDSDRLEISYEATTDADTPVNLTNHCFFNLSGIEGSRIDNHVLEMDAPFYLPVNANGIPLGRKGVSHSIYDFRAPRKLGALDGYDNAWIFSEGEGVRTLASVRDPHSGRGMILSTDQKSVQLYTAKNNHFIGRGGVQYGPYSGFCLETQGYVNAVNNPSFPSIIVKKGETYHHEVSYGFVW